LKETNLSDIFYSIGIGIFGFSTLTTFSYLIGDLSQKILMVFDVNPAINMWTKTMIKIILFWCFALILIKWVKNHKNFFMCNTRKVFVIAIITFIVSQGFQVLFTSFGYPLFFENHIESWSKLREYQGNNSILMAISIFIGYGSYLIATLLIFRSIKNK